MGGEGEKLHMSYIVAFTLFTEGNIVELQLFLLYSNPTLSYCNQSGTIHFNVAKLKV